MSSPPESTQIAAPAGEAVAEILACADIAVNSIARQAEQEVAAMYAASAVEQEALQRQARLEALRTDLNDRAAALAEAYRAIYEELEAVEGMLATIAQGTAYGAVPRREPVDPRVAAIKMTLRERQRIVIPEDPAPAEPEAYQQVAHRVEEAPWAQGDVAVEQSAWVQPSQPVPAWGAAPEAPATHLPAQPVHSTPAQEAWQAPPWAPAPQQQIPAPDPAQAPLAQEPPRPRRSWLPWQRAA